MQLATGYYDDKGNVFQSSPVPEDGCNLQGCRCGSDDWGFNPHPSRRTGATRTPHPVNWHLGDVSILTRPEGRVQLRLPLS